MIGRFAGALGRLVARDPEMDCRQAARVLQSYLDDELDDDRRRALEAHLERCRECGLEASVYREVRENLAGLSEPIPPETIERLRVFSEHLVSDGG